MASLDAYNFCAHNKINGKHPHLLHKGCGSCPACILRNDGILAFQKDHPHVILPYSFLKEESEKACIFSK